MRRRTVLARLSQELSTIEAFDRVHDLSPNSGPAEDYAYAVRQTRRSQIMSEMKRLTAEPKYKKWVRISSAFVLFSAVGYATLHFLLR